MLNKVGYGMDDTDLVIDLVYNPSGAFLPGDQDSLEQDFKTRLYEDYGIRFNLPISRLLDFLFANDNYEEYMEKLVNAFNPAALKGLMR